MQKVASLSIAGALSGKVRQGDLVIPKGKKMPGIRLKCTLPIKNTGGGNAAMTDAERQAVLATITATLKYGRTGDLQPYQALSFQRLQREARYAYGTELEGYTDSTTGLATVINAGATTSLVLWMLIPTGRQWWLGADHQDDGAMGRSQAATVELELRKTVADLTAIGGGGNFQFNGTTTFDVYPDLVSCKGDRWALQAEYREFDESSIEVNLPDGVPFRVTERTAANASTSLTNLTVRIDDELMVDQVGPKDVITRYNDVPNVPADASIADRETFIYVPLPGTQKKDLPSGRVRVRQNVKDLATIKLSLLYVPYYPRHILESEFDHIANALRLKPIRAALAHVVEGRGAQVPQRLTVLEPAVLFDRDDREFEQAPGYVAEPGKKGDISVPKGVLEQAKAQVALHHAAGEEKAASYVEKQLAAAIPGGVQGGRGFRNAFSTVFERVTGFFR